MKVDGGCKGLTEGQWWRGFGEVVMRIQGAEGLILLRELMIV